MEYQIEETGILRGCAARNGVGTSTVESERRGGMPLSLRSDHNAHTERAVFVRSALGSE